MLYEKREVDSVLEEIMSEKAKLICFYNSKYNLYWYMEVPYDSRNISASNSAFNKEI